MFMTTKRHNEILAQERSRNEVMKVTVHRNARLAADYRSERDKAHQALHDIVAMETTNCASIGKRMAARARDEMND